MESKVKRTRRTQKQMQEALNKAKPKPAKRRVEISQAELNRLRGHG